MSKLLRAFQAAKDATTTYLEATHSKSCTTDISAQYKAALQRFDQQKRECGAIGLGKKVNELQAALVKHSADVEKRLKDGQK